MQSQKCRGAASEAPPMEDRVKLIRHQLTGKLIFKKICAQMRAHKLFLCARTFFRASVSLCLVRAHLWTYLHENFVSWCRISLSLKFHKDPSISWGDTYLIFVTSNNLENNKKGIFGIQNQPCCYIFIWTWTKLQYLEIRYWCTVVKVILICNIH